MKPQKPKVVEHVLNPATEFLTQPYIQSDGTVDLAKLRKYQNRPSTQASIALTNLFYQAQGLQPPRSYNPHPPYESIEGGDPVAIEAYARLVRAHVANLNSLMATHREFLLPISRKCFSWPMLISKRKVFGDDPDKIIDDFKVGADTIAEDSAARFNPKSKFGNIALNLIERIENCRTTPIQWLQISWMLSNTSCSWANDAQKLRAFSTKASSEEQKKWLEVMEQVLDEDFRDPRKSGDYLSLLTKPSYTKKRRLKAAIFDKVRNEFATLWGSRRQPKK